jgi:hypothetical protein
MASLETVQINDFTGGLNYRADAFQLADNESPDMLNVDIDPRGGFSQRNGVRDYNDSAIGSLASGTFDPYRIFAWDGNTRQLFVSANNKVYWTKTDAFTDMGVTTDADDGAQFGAWSNSGTSFLYGSAGGSNNCFRWDGIGGSPTATLLTASGLTASDWQNSYVGASGSHCPRAEHMTVHGDRLWVGHTFDGDGSGGVVPFPDRVRFSHPGNPECWRELDYIDVVGGGRGIKAIVSFGDQLLVFKPRAVFAILGFDENTFQLVQLTNQLGVPSPKAVTATESRVYMFSWPDGLFMFDGSRFTDLFQKMRPIIQIGEMNDESLDGIYLSWVDRKVMLSLPVGVDPNDSENFDEAGVSFNDIDVKFNGSIQASVPTSTFVWDQTVGSGGAWSRYTLAGGFGFAGATEFIDDSGRRLPVGLHPSEPYVLEIDVAGSAQDTVAGVPQNFDAYYVTKWQDAGSPNNKKFWRRPEFVVRQLGENTTIDVDVFHNWDRSASQRTFQLEFDGTSFSGGYESWVQPDLGSDLVKGTNLGLANSVQLKVSGVGNQAWGVNGIVHKFNPRRSRL